MKVKDLIEQLKQLDPELEVKAEEYYKGEYEVNSVDVVGTSENEWVLIR